MLKMGYEGKGLGKHAQGMIVPILVEEIPTKFGIGYVQAYGEAGASTCSSPHEGKNDGHVKQHLRYNSSHSQVDYVSDKHDKYACLNGRKSCCAYCGLCNHVVSKCWNRMKLYRK